MTSSRRTIRIVRTLCTLLLLLYRQFVIFNESTTFFLNREKTNKIVNYKYYYSKERKILYQYIVYIYVYLTLLMIIVLKTVITYIFNLIYFNFFFFFDWPSEPFKVTYRKISTRKLLLAADDREIHYSPGSLISS